MKRTNDDLQSIPGVGPSIAQNLIDIGIRSVDELRGQDPQKLYERSNRHAGAIQDPCLLYVFRCAVYYAEGGREPDKLKWWSWRDRSLR